MFAKLCPPLANTITVQYVLEILSATMCFTIWVKIIRMGNMHFLCHFLSVFMVTWSQNELSEGWEKNPQLTSTLRTVMAWLCFYGKWAQFNTFND